jgi:hypothetical protein
MIVACYLEPTRLPTKGNDGWQAADSCAAFAADGDGGVIANAAHSALKRLRIWIWPMNARILTSFGT